MDLAFLAEMLVEAAYPPWAIPRPTSEGALADPRAGRYLRDWGRAGDTGVIAEDDEGRPVGAAWYRRFPADEPGHGFVATDIPELAIAVVDEHRARGIGSSLLRALVEEARSRGERGLSLSVSAQNPAAIRIYQRMGFVHVGGTDDHPTLLLSLAPEQNEAPSGSGRQHD
jgi:ribosomal protein S18 acetylase RimI-like enzyme